MGFFLSFSIGLFLFSFLFVVAFIGGGAVGSEILRWVRLPPRIGLRTARRIWDNSPGSEGPITAPVIDICKDQNLTMKRDPPGDGGPLVGGQCP